MTFIIQEHKGRQGNTGMPGQSKQFQAIITFCCAGHEIIITGFPETVIGYQSIFSNEVYKTKLTILLNCS